MTSTADRTTAGVTDSPRTVSVSHVYRASVEAAYDAWINPRSLEQWFGPPGFRTEVLAHDPRVGGEWRFRMIGPNDVVYHHFGAFVEISPPRRLVFTWASDEQVEGWRDENGAPTRVTVDFHRRNDGVAVRITHERLQSEDAHRALTGGWSGGLEALDDFLKGSKSQ